MDFKAIYSEERPWGAFHNLIESENFKLKLIEVAPLKRLSLQSHNLRSEHWVVVEGEARIVNGDDTNIYKKGDHIFIPRTNKHRLENISSKDILRVVEVQTGEYFGEDDIIRYDDDFNRT